MFWFVRKLLLSPTCPRGDVHVEEVEQVGAVVQRRPPLQIVVLHLPEDGSAHYGDEVIDHRQAHHQKPAVVLALWKQTKIRDENAQNKAILDILRRGLFCAVHKTCVLMGFGMILLVHLSQELHIRLR